MTRTASAGTPIRGAAVAGAASWQGIVKDKDLTAPPGSPSVGDRYIVASVATGAWTGEEDNIAEWDGDTWIFAVPEGGWVVYVEDEGEIYAWNGSTWGQESFGPHATTHEDGGPDEISVAALSGLLADNQNPTVHAALHKGGGADEVDGATSSVAGLMSAADKATRDASATVIKTSDDIKAILEAAASGSSFWLEDGMHTPTALITISDKKDISIRGSRAANVSRSGSVFKTEGCEDIVLQGFTLTISGAAGIGIEFVKLGSGTYVIPTRCIVRDIHFVLTHTSSIVGIAIYDDFLQGTIEDNDFSGSNPSGTCIHVNAVDGGEEVADLMIHKNRCADHLAGVIVNVAVPSRIFVIGNSFFGTEQELRCPLVFGFNILQGSDMPLSIAGWDILVIGNTISDSTGANVSFAGGARTQLIGNTIRGATDEGVLLYQSTDVSFIGNIIDNNGDDGISVKAIAGDRIYVAGNQITNNGGYGLEITIGTGHRIEGNYYYNNTSGPENITVASYKKGFAKDVNEVATTDATVTTIATIPIPDDTTVWIEVNVINRQTNAANRGKFKRGALVYREAAGAATKEGATWTPLTIKSVLPAQWDVDIVTSGNNALIQVEGLAAQNINWESRHTVEERS